jgi:2,4-dienoyl-CoA reductase-like NADH-dependent reductase (Old Yellow Enzyme family)/thioredoxin reductase
MKPAYLERYPHVFEPLYVKSAKTPFKNRVLCSPNGIPWYFGFSDLGEINEYGIDYFAELARGGTSAVNLLLFFSNDEHMSYAPVVSDGNHMKMHMMQRAVHAYGAKSFAELCHAGRCAVGMGLHDDPILASTSGIYQGKPIKGMDEADMQKVIDQHVRIALDCKRSGFDGVQLHFAHGWLAHDFLSPLSNKRTDEYGGSVENRVRFPLRIVKAIREAVGDDMLIELRLDGWDGLEGGITPEDAAQQILLFQDYVDMAHVSCGTRLDNRTRAMMIPTYMIERQHNVWASEIVKNTPGIKIPIGVVGYISTADECEEILAAGKADYILMARAFVADPEWLQKAKEGREEDIRPCIHCSYCIDHGRRKALFKNNELALVDKPKNDSGCAVNPFACQGISRKFLPKPTRLKNVAVVGGGIAGMNAALAAADHGHKVTLYEGSQHLGGQVRITDGVEFKADLKAYHEYLECQIKKHPNIDLKLGVRATPELIQESDAETAIIAIGAKQRSSNIPGSEKATPSMAAFRNPEKFGKRVVIIGGGHVGVELGIYLANGDRKITVIDKKEFILQTAELSVRVSLLNEAAKRNIELFDSTAAVEILDGGVKVSNAQKGEYVIEADSVILAIGTEALVEQREGFRYSATDVIFVGDVLDDGLLDLPHAVETGFNAGFSV